MLTILAFSIDLFKTFETPVTSCLEYKNYIAGPFQEHTWNASSPLMYLVTSFVP